MMKSEINGKPVVYGQVKGKPEGTSDWLYSDTLEPVSIEDRKANPELTIKEHEFNEKKEYQKTLDTKVNSFLEEMDNMGVKSLVMVYSPKLEQSGVWTTNNTTEFDQLAFQKLAESF